MGEKVNRIEREFVLKSLAEKRIPATARWAADRVEVLVKEITEKAVVVEPQRAIKWRAGDPVEVFFVFQNNNHTFSSRILEVEAGRCRIAMPGSLYKSLQRQFDRVRSPEGFNVSFRLAGAGSIELVFPVSGASPANTPQPQPQPDRAFDPAAIKELVEQFNEKARAEASEGRIVMMRNRAATSYEELIMQATGKALWVPSTDEDFPNRSPVPEPRVLTKADIVKYERSCGTDAGLILSRIADILYRKRREGIESELCWPLFHQRYFVGYLHLLTRAGVPRIGSALVEWVGQFGVILGYSLEHSGYYKDEGVHARPYQAEPVDLSASGLLFAHPDKELYKKLLVHSDIQVGLRARTRRMTVGARVIRKLMDRDRVYVALRFLEISPEDFRYLYETLYGRAFDLQTIASETPGPPEPS